MGIHTCLTLATADCREGGGRERKICGKGACILDFPRKRAGSLTAACKWPLGAILGWGSKTEGYKWLQRGGGKSRRGTSYTTESNLEEWGGGYKMQKINKLEVIMKPTKSTINAFKTSACSVAKLA